MATDPTEELKNLRATMASIEAVLDVDRLRMQIAELEEQASAPDLWNDQAKAQAVTSKLSGLQAELNRFSTLNRRLEDLEVLFELAESEGDVDALAEVQGELIAVSKARRRAGGAHPALRGVRLA